MTDPMAEVMRGLRREYLKDSVVRVAELEQLGARVAAGDDTALDALRRAFHKLAGSGGSYGFETVSVESRTGEHLAKRLLDAGAPPPAPDRAALQAAVAAVAAAFAAARAAEGGVAGA